MVKFVNDIKNYLQSVLTEADAGVTVRDYIPDGEPADDTVYVSSASLKTDKQYESFDLTTAAQAEIDFRTVTKTSETGSAEERNERCIGALQSAFGGGAAPAWNISVLRTDITAFESPHPISDADGRYESVVRVQFTFLMPYAALK